MTIRVHQHILGFDVSVADTHGMNICYGSQKLIRIYLYVDIWDVLLLLHVIFHDFVKSFRDMLHHNVQVNFIWSLTIRIEKVLHLDTKRMS